MSPCICEHKKSGKGWWYIRVIRPSHQDAIHIFSWLKLTRYSRLNRGTNKSKYWGNICTSLGNTVGSDNKTGNPISSLPEQTWCTSKGGTYIKGDSTSKGGHYFTTKGIANNQCTRSKGGYTPNTSTNHNIYLHNKVDVQREEIQYNTIVRNDIFIKLNRNRTNTDIFRPRIHYSSIHVWRKSLPSRRSRKFYDISSYRSGNVVYESYERQ